jgi:hypothetical protein
MHSPDPAERMAIVEKTDDQALLAQAAKGDADPAVRRAAVIRLSDQAALAGIAVDDPDENVRYAAAGMIRDRERLDVVVLTNVNRAKDASWKARGWVCEWNRMELIQQLRQRLEDQGIDKRLGWLRVDLTVETETADYAMSAGGPTITDARTYNPYHGEVVTISLWRGDEKMAEEHWRYVFPKDTHSLAMHEQADVDLDDLIWDLQD